MRWGWYSGKFLLFEKFTHVEHLFLVKSVPLFIFCAPVHPFPSIFSFPISSCCLRLWQSPGTWVLLLCVSAQDIDRAKGADNPEPAKAIPLKWVSLQVESSQEANAEVMREMTKKLYSQYEEKLHEEQQKHSAEKEALLVSLPCCQ